MHSPMGLILEFHLGLMRSTVLKAWPNWAKLRTPCIRQHFPDFMAYGDAGQNGMDVDILILDLSPMEAPIEQPWCDDGIFCVCQGLR